MISFDNFFNSQKNAEKKVKGGMLGQGMQGGIQGPASAPATLDTSFAPTVEQPAIEAKRGPLFKGDGTSGDNNPVDGLGNVPLIGGFYKAGTKMSEGIVGDDPESLKKQRLAGFIHPGQNIGDAIKSGDVTKLFGGAKRRVAAAKKQRLIAENKVMIDNNQQGALQRNLTPKPKALPFGG